MHHCRSRAAHPQIYPPGGGLEGAVDDLISPNNQDDLPGSFPPPLIVDESPKAAFESAGHMLLGAICRDPEPQPIVELMLAE